MMPYKLITLLLFFTASVAWSQTIPIPDVNLRNKLNADYPQVMQGNQLDINAAAALTGPVYLNNANIENAEGVQYFTSAHTLSLNSNRLTTIPDISNLSNLENLFVSYNQIQSLPSLSGLKSLKDFQTIDNPLNELPDLSGCTQLVSIYSTNNRLTKLPDLSQFPNLKILVVGDNPFQEAINFSECTGLTQLHIHKTNTNTLNGIQQLTQLEVLYAWGNQIKDFSPVNALTELSILHIADNPASTLPVIDNKPNLNVFDITNCFFTFEDIIPVLNTNPSFSFNYAPQKPFNYNNITARDQYNLILSYPETTPSATNSYVWYKDGEKLDSSTSKSYVFSPVSYADEGEYQLKVYNSEVTHLVLESTPFILTVSPCLEFNLPYVDVITKDCSDGYTIDLMNATVSGGTKPFTYTLKSNSFEESYTTEQIENLPAGKYEITLTDAKNCQAKTDFTLNRIERCDPVLTPDGDGVADSFFIEQQGVIKIYDMKRTLITTLEGPANWNGTDKNGTLVDAGYYIIIPEESNKAIYVTIIR